MKLTGHLCEKWEPICGLHKHRQSETAIRDLRGGWSGPKLKQTNKLGYINSTHRSAAPGETETKAANISQLKLKTMDSSGVLSNELFI